MTDKTPSEAELLPCPFCGEAAKHSFNSLYGDMSMASCKSCGATAYAPKWNRRAVLAKWGQPAQAAEPVAVVVPCYTPSGKRVALCSAKQDLPIGTKLYAAPQPSYTPQAADSVQEDAARYRLLRRGQHWSVIDGIGNDLRAEALDAAVDAARKQGASNDR